MQLSPVLFLFSSDTSFCVALGSESSLISVGHVNMDVEL